MSTRCRCPASSNAGCRTTGLSPRARRSLLTRHNNPDRSCASLTPGLYGASASEHGAACAVPDASAQPTTIASNPTKTRLTAGHTRPLAREKPLRLLEVAPHLAQQRAARELGDDDPPDRPERMVVVQRVSQLEGRTRAG